MQEKTIVSLSVQCEGNGAPSDVPADAKVKAKAVIADAISKRQKRKQKTSLIFGVASLIHNVRMQPVQALFSFWKESSVLMHICNG
ncbi:hypothetical protein Gbem_4085 [Citrifermentans bemidjiense Bem]|uniref:Uncharacterized protein n=1 Tax=Citrifermentans bemidjiense (strain ATCC BAA-1014 / DSM 16622 / JCM 12645 / Bem) TaxID=404380 RepID=E1P691_CITBB|nr:hypothetical protein [Citrifermentans bemidjiense]ADO00786.1 hypothetical protein Gbem_4085 [Citrifermentans bemidjiense Bem]